MKKTTIVLAFCATLLITTSAAALVLTQQPARKPAKRKGETDIATRVFTPTIKEGRKVIDRPAPETGAEPVGPTAEVTAPKPDATVAAELPSQPVIEAEGEPELITEYYPNGNLRAVYRGFRQKPIKLERGSVSVTWSSDANFNGAIIERSNLIQNDNSSGLAKEQRAMFSNEQRLEIEPQIKLVECINSEYSTQSLGTIMLEIPAVRHGSYESYYEDGRLESRGEFDHGAYKGSWNFYYANGNLRESGEFVNNARHGHWTSYHENGLRASETDWANGVENGSHTDWFANGLMCAQGAMKDGLRHGYWMYWSEDGAKVREGNCENGNETGDWQEYQPILRKQQCEQQAIEDNVQELDNNTVQIKTVVYTK